MGSHAKSIVGSGDNSRRNSRMVPPKSARVRHSGVFSTINPELREGDMTSVSNVSRNTIVSGVRRNSKHI